MKWFYTIFQAILLIILIVNPLIVFLFWENFLDFNNQTKLNILAWLIIVEFLTIIFLVKKFFHDPIIKLEYTIKSFLVEQ